MKKDVVCDETIEGIKNYEEMKNKIIFRMIKRRGNERWLNKIPHIEFLDTVIIFYVLLSDTEEEQCVRLIDSHCKKSWNLEVDELYRTAKNNTPRLLPAEIKSLSDVIREIVGRYSEQRYCERHIESLFLHDQKPIYVLTNETEIYGACCLLYENLLKEFAQRMESDLYILLSSVHEALVIPDSNSCSAELLKEMVIRVNSGGGVGKKEVLSNHVYYYDYMNDEIRIEL